MRKNFAEVQVGQQWTKWRYKHWPLVVEIVDVGPLHIRANKRGRDVPARKIVGKLVTRVSGPEQVLELRLEDFSPRPYQQFPIYPKWDGTPTTCFLRTK